MLYEKSKSKNITSDRAEIKKIVEDALNKMATIVGATLGPGGRPVIIDRGNLAPLVTKDGVTVAKHLGVSNAEANLIIDAAKEICLNTAKMAGDGTTTAIVLANAITHYGLKFLQDNPKYNPQRMVNELNDLYENVIVPFLKAQAVKVSTEEELINVATISANGDRKIAKAAVEAVMAAGEDGTVLIEESQDIGIKVESIDGFIITSGLRELGQFGPAFINDRSGQQARLDKGLIFLYDGSINDLKVLSKIQTAVEGTDFYGSPIVVAAHNFADVALDAMAKTTKGGYTVIPVKTPMGGYANSRTMFLHDLSAYTGAKVYNPTLIEEDLIDADGNSGFGSFESAKVNLYEGVILANVDEEAIDTRVSELKAIAEVAPNEHERMHIKAAIGKLTGGISTVWVGGSSELEAREKKARLEDAVEAVRSAVAEGIIPGGCAAHLVLSDILSRREDFKPSWAIMVEALRHPFKILLSNCGEDFDEIWSVVCPQIIGNNNLPKLIFDANRHELVDPMVAGIIEPAKVCRVSTGNALSVASLLITLGGLVVTPRDSNLENQLELSKSAFKDMMSGNGMGQE